MDIKFKPDSAFELIESKNLRETLKLLARVTWAGDLDCDGANGPDFTEANGEADTLLRTWGMFPKYGGDEPCPKCGTKLGHHTGRCPYFPHVAFDC